MHDAATDPTDPLRRTERTGRLPKHRPKSNSWITEGVPDTMYREVTMQQSMPRTPLEEQSVKKPHQ